MKRLMVLTCLVAAFVGLAACSSTTPGQPGAATSAQDGGTTSVPPTSGTSPSTDGGHTLPADHPCSLLSSGDLSTLGASSAPTEEMTGTAHSCNFDSADFSIGVEVRTNAGLNGFQLPGGTPQKIMIGRHDAKRQATDTVGCTVAIGVSDSSRVDVVVTPVSDGDPCPTALKIANMVEPQLP